MRLMLMCTLFLEGSCFVAGSNLPLLSLMLVVPKKKSDGLSENETKFLALL